MQVENEGDVATAFTLARILSNIPPSRGGPASIVIFDIHALQERFYFGDGVLPLFESGIPLLLDRLKQLPDKDKARSHAVAGATALQHPPPPPHAHTHTHTHTHTHGITPWQSAPGALHLSRS
jgi:hypothetical protein